MLTKAQYYEARHNALRYFKLACIAITPAEADRLEVADAGYQALATLGPVLQAIWGDTVAGRLTEAQPAYQRGRQRVC